VITRTSINALSLPTIFSLPDARQDVCPFDDEDQLAAEMAHTLLDITQDQPLPDIDPDDFEKLYHWFYS
jgi:hypothetical protein